MFMIWFFVSQSYVRTPVTFAHFQPLLLNIPRKLQSGGTEADNSWNQTFEINESYAALC